MLKFGILIRFGSLLKGEIETGSKKTIESLFHVIRLYKLQANVRFYHVLARYIEVKPEE